MSADPDLWENEHEIAGIEQDSSVLIYIKSLYHVTIDTLKSTRDGFERAQICRIFEKAVREAEIRNHSSCLKELAETLYEIGPANDKQEILDWLDHALDPINKELDELEDRFQELQGE